MFAAKNDKEARIFDKFGREPKIEYSVGFDKHVVVGPRNTDELPSIYIYLQRIVNLGAQHAYSFVSALNEKRTHHQLE